MLEALFKYDFLQNALFAGLLASIICGIIGVIITEKKLLIMSGGIAHTAYGGVGLGYLLGFEPILGAGIFAVGAALVIGAVRRKNTAKSDIIISLLWSLGMALGIAFTSLMPGYPPDINSYLFGNILSVTRLDLTIMLPLTVIVLFAIISLFNDWKSFLFDSSFAKICGIKTAFLEYLLLILTALSIVSLIRVVGIILVIALLTAPAACSSLLAKTLKIRIFIAVLLSACFCITGLTLSFYFGIASGAAIVFISVLTYFIILIVKKCLDHSCKTQKKSV